MFRIIPTFLLTIGVLLCVNSCDLSMYGTYTFSHNVIYTLQDDSDETAEDIESLIIDYLGKYIDFEEQITFTGSHSDALEYGNNILSELFNNFSNDENYISSLLQTGESVQYSLYMSGEKTHELIGYCLWLPIEEEDDEE